MSRAGIVWSDCHEALAHGIEEVPQDRRLDSLPAPKHGNRNGSDIPAPQWCSKAPVSLGSNEAWDKRTADARFYQAPDRNEAAELPGDAWSTGAPGREGVVEHLTVDAARLGHEERLVHEVFGVDHVLSGKPVPGRCNDDKVLLGDKLVVQVGLERTRAKGKADVHEAASHALAQVATACGPHLEVEGWVLRLIPSKERWQPSGAQGLEGPDGQVPCGELARVSDGRPYLIGEGEQVAGIVEQTPPGLCQLQPAP
jgi:hypothetical protein